MNNRFDNKGGLAGILVFGVLVVVSASEAGSAHVDLITTLWSALRFT